LSPDRRGGAKKTFVLDTSSNGLTCLVDRLKREALSGHVLLTRGERSDVAELCARLL
jgi:PhoH-like ATPase